MDARNFSEQDIAEGSMKAFSGLALLGGSFWSSGADVPVHFREREVELHADRAAICQQMTCVGLGWWQLMVQQETVVDTRTLSIELTSYDAEDKVIIPYMHEVTSQTRHLDLRPATSHVPNFKRAGISRKTLEARG
jgi:hypothetical protein